MKNTDKIIDKLISYARENLMLDALDETYARNRLCALLKVKPGAADADAPEYENVEELAKELNAAYPDVALDAVMDVLMPAPHMIDYWFADEMGRSPQKAFDFLYELYGLAACVSPSAACNKDGYVHYEKHADACQRPIMLDANGASPYTPRVSGNRIATLACDDVFSADIAAKLGAFVSAYGGAIAKKIGSSGDYACCSDIAPAHASIKKQLKDGAVKVGLLDYPVPALAFSGIAKNAVEREVAGVIKRAADAGLACTAACARDKSGSHVFYVIFAGDIAADEVSSPEPVLGACGVFETVELASLISVLEKGTALSTDLFMFKKIYSAIGGVKHGAKAAAVLTDALVAEYKTALAAAASATEDKAVELLGGAE